MRTTAELQQTLDIGNELRQERQAINETTVTARAYYTDDFHTPRQIHIEIINNPLKTMTHFSKAQLKIRDSYRNMGYATTYSEMDGKERVTSYHGYEFRLDLSQVYDSFIANQNQINNEALIKTWKENIECLEYNSDCVLEIHNSDFSVLAKRIETVLAESPRHVYRAALQRLQQYFTEMSAFSINEKSERQAIMLKYSQDPANSIMTFFRGPTYPQLKFERNGKCLHFMTTANTYRSIKDIVGDSLNNCTEFAIRASWLGKRGSYQPYPLYSPIEDPELRTETQPKVARAALV